MSQKRQRFAQLLAGAVNAAAAFERKSTRAVAQEFGEAIGRSFHTIEHYKSAKAAPTEPAQVRALAALGVARARLNAVWLREFLASLDYPDPEPLVAELCGDGRAPASLARQAAGAPWYDNLEPPPYGRFVMRQEALGALIDGLRGYQTTVLLGLGGMGKTSLAHYVATRCKGEHAGAPAGWGRLPAALPPVDAVVWLSDHAHPGALTLPAALDTVVRALDHGGLTALEPAARRQGVEALLQRRHALLVADNLETVEDEALIQWLLRLPPPTRLLITTRVRRPEFLGDRVCLIELGGMVEGEIGRLVGERAAQVQLGGGVGAAEIAALAALTGGNPLALRQVIGYLKRTGQPLAAAAGVFGAVAGDLLPALFGRAWALLPAEARRLLLAASLFPASAARAVLGQVAGLDGPALDQGVAALTESALVEVGQGEGDEQPRVSLHPLTYRFVSEQHGAYAGELEELTERWLAWAVAYAARFGYQLREPGRLRALDADEESLFAALLQASREGRHDDVIALCRGLEFYYYTRGWWGRKGQLHEHYIAAAERSGDHAALVSALTMHIQHLCRLDQTGEAAAYLGRLARLPGVDELGGEAAFHVAHARGLHALTVGDYVAAQALWQRVLDNAGPWALPDHMAIGAQHWLGICAQRAGDQPAAAAWFRRSLAGARGAGYARWIARNQIQLAHLAIASGDPREASERLAEAERHTQQDDREQLAHYYRARAYLQRAQGRPVEAQSDYYMARDLFTRMGLAHLLRDDAGSLVTMSWDEE